MRNFSSESDATRPIDNAVARLMRDKADDAFEKFETAKSPVPPLIAEDLGSGDHVPLPPKSIPPKVFSKGGDPRQKLGTPIAIDRRPLSLTIAAVAASALGLYAIYWSSQHEARISQAEDRVSQTENRVSQAESRVKNEEADFGAFKTSAENTMRSEQDELQRLRNSVANLQMENQQLKEGIQECRAKLSEILAQLEGKPDPR